MPMRVVYALERMHDGVFRILTLMCMVGVAVLLILVVKQQHKTEKLALENRQLVAQQTIDRRVGRLVLCREINKVKIAERNSLTQQIAEAQKFLRKHPEGTVDFGPKLIRRSIRRLKRLRGSLKIINCKTFSIVSTPFPNTLILTGTGEITVSRGTVGPRGAQGAQGRTGSKGSVGSKGAQGERGSQGFPGLNGANGARGPQGQRGAQGPPGARGPAGPQGATGPAGPPGAGGQCVWIKVRIPSDQEHIFCTQSG